MVNRTYLELLGNLLAWDLKLLCPWKIGSENKKLTKLFRASVASPFITALITTSFAYYKWDSLSVIAIFENVAIALLYARDIGYISLVKLFYHQYKQQVDKLLDDRKSLPMEAQEQATTEKHCKTDFILTLATHLIIYFMIFIFFHAMVYLSPNAYKLPFNCYLIFLPIDSFLFAWEINYLIITIMVTLPPFFVTSYVSLPFVLMNHSYWLLDMALVAAEKVNLDLQPNEETRTHERVEKVNESLKKFVVRCEIFVERYSEIQDLLFWYFNLEFHVQSLMLCFMIYVLSSTISGGVTLAVFAFCAVQVFVLSWMGTRVTSRIDQLCNEISKNWYLMQPKQRKELQMILHWTQNMKGFSGLFKDVSLETCKSIFEASYSFYAFLRSTNAE